MTRRNKLRVILTLAMLAVPLMASLNSVKAAKLTDVKDVVSDSGAAADANHEVSFNSTSGIAEDDTVVLAFGNGSQYTFGSLALGDIDLNTGTCGSEGSEVLAGSKTGTTWGVVINNTNETITFTAGSGGVSAGDCVVVLIGTNASGGTNQITNPGVGVYDLGITTTSDDGVTKLAVLSHVTADVTVDETLTFTVSGVTSGSCTATGNTTTTPTSISYGSVNADTFYGGCQELLVSTNAAGGYSVTVQQDGPLTSAATDTIDGGSCDGTCTITAGTAWATSTNNGFGYRVDDTVGTDGVETGATNYRLLGTIGTDTPEVIMSNAGVVSGSEIEVFYQISIDGAQEAGTYENEIVYVATPTY